MLVVGLTGDVGAGKSTARQFWEKMGAAAIDADALAKDLWAEPDILQQATTRWGNGIVDSDGRIIPSRVSSIVFENYEEYRWLCDLLHPRVRTLMEKFVENSRGWTVVELPLLFEGGIPWWMDLTVYIAAPRDVRVGRNAHRNWNISEITRRESCLLPRTDKIGQADFVITNTGTLEDLKTELTRLGQEMRSMSAITEIHFSFSDTETARAFGSELTTRNLAADLALNTAEFLDTGEPKNIMRGFCLKQNLPVIRKLLKRQKPSKGTVWTHPVCHMDLTSLKRLSEELSP